MRIPFTEYLHGNKESGYDLAERLVVDHDLDLTDKEMRDLAMCLYEVKLHLHFDTETKKVILVGAEL